jgi:hypothetical protein
LYPFTAGYLDDFSLRGPEDVVARDIENVLMHGVALRLNLHTAKCKVIRHSTYKIGAVNLVAFIQLDQVHSSLPGDPLLVGGQLDNCLAHCWYELTVAIDKLSTISSHDALIVLRTSFSALRIQYVQRCSPCVDHPGLVKFDELVRTGVGRIANVNLSDHQWFQTSLPVLDGAWS